MSDNAWLKVRCVKCLMVLGEFTAEDDHSGVCGMPFLWGGDICK